jgi:hypothetical protein
MKQVVFISVSLFLLVFIITFPVYAYGHVYVRGGVWIGPGWWGPWWGPSPYPYGYYESPPVVMEQQPAYDQQAPQQEEQQYYWYYCAESKTYYPYVKQCPGGWMKVVPTPQTPPRGKE